MRLLNYFSGMLKSIVRRQRKACELEASDRRVGNSYKGNAMRVFTGSVTENVND